MQQTGYLQVLGLTLILIATSVAAEIQSGHQSIELDPIVVVASKRPRPLSNVVGQVSVIDADYIERYLVESVDDLLRYEPGINLEGSGTRFGANAVNIRGIGGNRVAIEVDGIPVRDRFAIGNFSDGGRILSETDRIKRVEVLYGPASTLYGSDALGGVMAVTTWDPDDLLTRGNGTSRYSLRAGYQGANDSIVGSGLAAWGNDRNGLLFAGTWRDGHEPGNQAPANTARDKQDWSSEDYFLRYTHDTDHGNRLRFTYNDFRRDIKTNIESLPGNGRFRSTTSLIGDDSDESRKLSMDYQFSGRWGDGVVRAFKTDSSTQQLTREERAASTRPIRLERLFRYDQDFSGLELNIFRDLSLAASHHHFGAGIEFQRADSSEIRDGFQQSLVDDSISTSVLGEDLPVRDFPNSRTDELGIFVQDEISLANGQWELVPAIRYDHYDLEPRPDAIYLEDNPETTVVAITEHHFSPRIGALYHVNDQLGLYAQYTNGFRAPPFEDANIGLDIPLFNIRAIPNPDLKSETSQGVEIGFRYITAGTLLTVALFDTQYDNFIDTKALIGTDPVSGVLLFQSRNIDQARIYGVDLRLEQALSAWSNVLENWSIKAAAYWSRGKNEENDQPLNSVSPAQMVLGLSWFSADHRWNANLAGTFTGRQNSIDESAGDRFHTPAWVTADLTLNWRVNHHFDISAGAYNLTDETYWRWSDVSLFSPDNPMLDLLSRPGRNYSLSARFQW